jgi:hypothetical protein
MRIKTLAVALLLALGGCSGVGYNAGPSPSPTGLTDDQIRVVIAELVDCIRKNGAPGMPDVQVRNGKVIEPDENSVDEATKRNVDAAMAACESIKKRLPDSVFRDDDTDQQTETDQREGPGPEDVPVLKKFAQCMRENGMPEWPDPKADGTFPIIGTPLEAEGKSKRLLDTWAKCKQHWDRTITFS